MREIRLSGSMSGNRKQSQAKPDCGGGAKATSKIHRETTVTAPVLDSTQNPHSRANKQRTLARTPDNDSCHRLSALPRSVNALHASCRALSACDPLETTCTLRQASTCQLSLGARACTDLPSLSPHFSQSLPSASLPPSWRSYTLHNRKATGPRCPPIR